ncbi:MAG: Rrf2 family transcriptional regulator [Candidatus Omnitrophica bacterium]|nr:Rrf2 family transcriptional regulator [Candidatus Omnitrophota bacterium]
MFKIHKKVKYALTSLKYMKKKAVKELSTAKEICAAFKMPFDPTSRVLQIMTQHEILEAVQGAYGGYRLVGDLDKVSLYDLSRMVIGPIAVTACCSSDEPDCERVDACVLKTEMGRLNSRLVKLLKEIKVSEMI